MYLQYKCDSLAECYCHIDNVTKPIHLLKKSKVTVEIDENSETDDSYVNLFNTDLHHPIKKIYNLKELEKNTILEVIYEYSNYNDEDIAKILGIGIRTLYRKYKEYNIIKKNIKQNIRK